MHKLRLLRYKAHPLRLSGPIIEARLFGVKIGEICDIRSDCSESEVICRAQVLGFYNDRSVLSLIGNARGLSRDVVIIPTGAALLVTIDDSLLGSVVDPSGKIVAHLSEPAEIIHNPSIRAIDSPPPSYLHRLSIRDPFITGVKAIDGLITCGVGQRMGIFAAAGCGKTSLMHMLIEQADADVFVIGLVGERGREVTEFTEVLSRSGRAQKCIVVYATSDFSSLDRCNAALLATTIAEYFRDQGKKVVLFLDSITRYARALRDVALAAGEAPARRGYPASVFDSLPSILERPSNTKNGSITAFYTILLESDDEPDPIAEEIRSILDGHIYLSKKLAIKNHYPAIDVLHSISRVSSQICDTDHLSMAGEFRNILAKIQELQMFVELGEYRQGENAENDRAIKKRPALLKWLQQSMNEHSSFEQTLQAMNELTQ